MLSCPILFYSLLFLHRTYFSPFYSIPSYLNFYHILSDTFSVFDILFYFSQNTEINVRDIIQTLMALFSIYIQFQTRILSFDGGGTRGVLSIAMLKEIMSRISPNEKVQPYELFDIICGTSTGGIIAVLLGAQRRSVGETEALYDEFIDKVKR